ncbi:MAG TPA: hypothetical protein VEJ46_14045 [Candidatus Acidoferrum sp.]|nr:hypothetical protein [Candidatus Acidoferrum sp.]
MQEEREALLLRLPAKLKADVSALAKVHKRSTTKECELAIELHVAAQASPEAGAGATG